MSTKKITSIIFFFIILLLGYFGSRNISTQISPFQNGTNNIPSINSSQQQFPNPFGQQTKSSGCQTNEPFPDSACTPGAIIATATKDQICTPGYSKSVRNVPAQEKQEVYNEYGIASHSPGQYEVDHLISLELGGSNDISNLWPEAAEPRPGFHEKDMVENYLHAQVCSGSLSLQQAQQEIAKNWLQVYQNTPNIQQYRY